MWGCDAKYAHLTTTVSTYKHLPCCISVSTYERFLQGHPDQSKLELCRSYFFASGSCLLPLGSYWRPLRFDFNLYRCWRYSAVGQL